MMRVSALALWCALLGWIIASSRPARAQMNRSPVHDNIAFETWPTEVEGYGLTDSTAKSDAVRQALKDLEAAITKLDPPITHWTPDLEFVDQYLIRRPGFPGTEKAEKLQREGKIKFPGKIWIFPLRPLPVDTLRHFDRQERLAQRSHDRQLWMLRFVVATLLACFATLGVLHLSARGNPRPEGAKHYSPGQRPGEGTGPDAKP